MKRTIIVGDIHSCADELIELLDKVKFKKETSRLIFIGDLLGKGNKPLETFLIYKQTGAICIMGNAELAFLKNYEEPSFLKEYIEPTKKILGKYYTDFINQAYSFPHFLEEENFIAVHAGLLPNKKPQQMDLEDLVKIRKITDPQNPKILKSWFDFYKGKKLVVFGHWAALNGIVKENVIGLDTGCVYGKKLTALVLSDSASSPNSSKREIVSVQAKKQYLAIE